jgi:4-amino-4-deoxy-L-arabinose transferase-like glycosyltransferase
MIVETDLKKDETAGEIAGRLTTRQRVLLIALLSVAAIVYALPMGRRPITLQDEARMALLAEDTLRHGLRLPAEVRNEPYLNKPPLFFWSVALAARPAGHVSDRNAPIPSVVAALATLLGVFTLGRQLSGVHTGLMALVVLATSPGFFLRSHQVLPDMMLTAWLTWALVFLLGGLGSLPPRRAHVAGFYFCMAGALWTKGLACLWVIPAGVAAVAVTVGIRKLPSFRPVTGLGLVVLTALPWAIPYARSPGSAGSETISAGYALTTYLNHFRHHPSLPFVDGLVDFLPWALWLVPAAVWWRLTADRQRYRPVLAWMAVFLLLLGLSVYQRAHYMLPVYPLFALCVAASVTAAASRARSLLRIHAILIAGLAAAPIVGGGLLLGARPMLRDWVSGFVSTWPWVASLAGIVVAGPAIALWSLRVHRSPSRALSWIAATLALVFGLGTGIYSASLAATYSIQAFAQRVRGSVEPDVPIVAYPDGSLLFDLYLDHPITEVRDRDMIARRLRSPAADQVLLPVTDWASLGRSADPSWCLLGEVALGSRSYVLLGPCR